MNEDGVHPSRGNDSNNDQDGVHPSRGNDSNGNVTPSRVNDVSAEHPSRDDSTAVNGTDVHPSQGNDIPDHPSQGNVDPPQAPLPKQSAFQPGKVDQGEALANFSSETSTRDERADLSNQSTTSGGVSLPETTSPNVHGSRSNDPYRLGSDDGTSENASSEDVASSFHEKHLHLKYR